MVSRLQVSERLRRKWGECQGEVIFEFLSIHHTRIGYICII